jgi:hypothetical protein
MKVYLWGAIILSLLSACSQDSIFEGVSQDSSKDTKIEQARIDLDNSNYDQVISDLSSIYNTTAINPVAAQLLASAYMGKAGVDLTIFVVNSSSSGVDPYNAVSSMISSSSVTVTKNGRYIDKSLMPTILENITNSKKALQVLTEKGKASNNDKIQLGIVSAAHFIMNLGIKTADGLSNARTSFSVPINTIAFKLYAENNYWFLIKPSTFKETTSDGTSSSFQDDLKNINDAILVFSEVYPKSNRIKDQLNSFLYSALDVTSDVTVTDDLIMTYTSTGLNNFVQRLAD